MATNRRDAETRRLAKLLARDLLAEGDPLNVRDRRCKRIQFITGTYGKDELPNGGFCRSALEDFFFRTLSPLRLRASAVKGK